MEIIFEKAVRVKVSRGENQSISLEQYPAVPDYTPMVMSRIEAQLPWKIEVLNADLDLHLISFTPLNPQYGNYIVLINSAQKRSMENQFNKIKESKTHLDKNVDNPIIGDFMKKVEEEKDKIDKTYIIYVSEGYTPRQLEYIETIPLVQIPRC
ncbi:MAG: hypothetical protein Q4C88_01010 [Akkermansia sp.]|nr:hypothetical protein [Akkermansia sp.]